MDTQGKDLEITPALVLCNAHIDPDSMSFGGIRSSEHEYGYVAFLPEPETLEEYGTEVPGWFKPIVELAYKHNCRFVIFDRDGPLVANLKIYEW